MKHKRTIFACLLVSLIAVFACFLVVLVAGRGKRELPGSYLFTSVVQLQIARSDWLRQGRPSNFDPGVTPTNGCFIFTNEVVLSNKLYHCCFGARNSFWPAGTLAITDDGVTLWVPDHGTNFIFSPEKGYVPYD